MDFSFLSDILKLYKYVKEFEILLKEYGISPLIIMVILLYHKKIFRFIKYKIFRFKVKKKKEHHFFCKKCYYYYIYKNYIKQIISSNENLLHYVIDNTFKKIENNYFHNKNIKISKLYFKEKNKILFDLKQIFLKKLSKEIRNLFYKFVFNSKVKLKENLEEVYIEQMMAPIKNVFNSNFYNEIYNLFRKYQINSEKLKEITLYTIENNLKDIHEEFEAKLKNFINDINNIFVFSEKKEVIENFVNIKTSGI